jgi:arylsulfatase A-like enzyme
MPFYNEVIRTPLFVWDPRAGRAGERRKSLVQTIDLAPTLLDYFGLAPLPDMQGVPLKETVAADKQIHEAGLFGIFGGHVNVTDGRYVYMRAPRSANEEAFEYTHMPTHMRRLFSVEEMRTMEAAGPFPFTKGCRTMKIRHSDGGWARAFEYGTLLFDNREDPAQDRPLKDAKAEKRMTELLVQTMKASDAPAEQYRRLGLG